MNPFPKVYPRLRDGAAGDLLMKVLASDVESLLAVSSADVSDASWYPMAPARATEAEIRQLQAGIRAIAELHGYPGPLAPGDKGRFDAALTRFFEEQLSMIPADAANDSVWAFLSLRVCPDVAMWRFPPSGALEDIPGTRRAERYNGQERDVFRRLWWRSFVLGADRVEQLIEDALVQVMERPEISGFRALARALVDAYLAKLKESPELSKQELMRTATKHLVLRMAVTSVYALDEQVLRAFADETVQQAALALGETPVAADKHSSHVAAESEGSATTPVEAEAAFLEACGPYREHVERIMRDASETQMQQIRGDVQVYRESVADHPEAVDLADQVEELLDRWDEFDAHERRIAYTAARYFIDHDDAVPDTSPGGFDDDEIVVRAARRAVGIG